MSYAKSELVRLSKFVGSQIPQWTQGAGGNISIKDTDKLWIKATGIRLDRVSENNGIAMLRYQKLREALKTLKSDDEMGYRDALEACTEIPKASMESGFHASMQEECVMHFHSLIAILLGHYFSKRDSEFLNWLSGQSMDIKFLGVKMPGLCLSQTVPPSAPVVVLQNHGVIIQSKIAQAQIHLKQWQELENAFCKRWKVRLIPATSSRQLLNYFPDVAVFSDRIQQIVDITPSAVRLKPRAFVTDRDAAEIVWAVQILERECPELAALPDGMCQTLPSLPTEQLRRKAA